MEAVVLDTVGHCHNKYILELYFNLNNEN